MPWTDAAALLIAGSTAAAMIIFAAAGNWDAAFESIWWGLTAYLVCAALDETIDQL